jgi:hypothetical protein
MWDNPTIHDQLVRQELISKGVPPEQIDGIMRQVSQAKSLRDKQATASDLAGIMNPPDSVQADNPLGNPWPGVENPQMPAVVSDEPPMVGDQATGDVSPSSTSPVATPQETMWDRLGPEGMEVMLNQGGIDDQRKQAELLRNKEGPTGIGGIGLSTGGTAYVAANPLSHLASGVEKYRAKKDLTRLREQEKEGNRTLLDLLRREKVETADEDDKVGFGLGVPT